MRIKEVILENTAIHLRGLPRFFKKEDPLVKYVPERATHTFALHPDKWESTFYSLTNKDPRKLNYYRPTDVEITADTLVADMAIANKFYRAKTEEEKLQFAKLYKDSLKPLNSVDISTYRMPELLIPNTQVNEQAEMIEESNAQYAPSGYLYHGTTKNVSGFSPFSHFGTIGAATDRLDDLDDGSWDYNKKNIYQVKLNMKNPANLGRDLQENHTLKEYVYGLLDMGVISREEFDSISDLKQLIDLIKSKGYDGLFYYNGTEDPGSRSYVILDPSQVKIVDVMNLGTKKGYDKMRRLLSKNPSRRSKNLRSVGVFENDESVPTIGINVRSDKTVDYADLIVDGKKYYESRRSDSLRPYVGRRVGIVKTGAGPAMAIGEVTVGEPTVVDEKQFRKLQDKHLVPRGSSFDIKPGTTKYLYPMLDPVRYDRPKSVGHGIIARKIV